jgi:single-strand DNA-binding protein
MAITTQVVVVGNLVRDPELRYSRQGKPVVNVTIASTPRSYNRETSQWEDGKAVFTRASAWDELAENIAGSLTKGSRVVAVGVLKASEYQDREGNKREGMELQIDEIGPSLRYHIAKPDKRGKSAPAAAQGPSQDSDGWAVVSDEDVPF